MLMVSRNIYGSIKKLWIWKMYENKKWIKLKENNRKLQKKLEKQKTKKVKKGKNENEN